MLLVLCLIGENLWKAITKVKTVDAIHQGRMEIAVITFTSRHG